MMKLASLLALLALVYGVHSVAISYDELVDAEEIVGEEPYPQTSPEIEQLDLDGPAENIKIPLTQYIQEIEEHLAEQAPMTEEMESESDVVDIMNTVDTADTADTMDTAVTGKLTEL